ncbi:MAG: hypothetical protein FJX47_09140 [Alphaproteobacteria bacterium]|nr:hypothetical protein [Alphaproteobacteria bacterium]
MKPDDQIKLFLANNLLIEQELDSVEKSSNIDLGRGVSRNGNLDLDKTYYVQIEQEYREEARFMSQHYEVMYSLEKSVRSLIKETMADMHGENWWDSNKIPDKIRQDVDQRIRREIDSAVTPRSDDPLDFTTFGELSEIIKHNKIDFEQIFSSMKAVDKVMSSLNTLRGPIAHCSKLAEDEVVRLRLVVRDWFRLME